MKATFFFTTLLILLSATITLSHLPSATADYVLDSNGNPLQFSQDYYILSVYSGAGGVTYPNTDNETCPTTVILSGDDYNPGSPMKFSSPMRARNIYEGLNLDFSFSSPPAAGCASSWTVVDGGSGELSINLGGVSGGEKYESSSSRVVSGWFSIESSRRYYDSYRLVFCIEGSRRCFDVGVRVDQNGVQSLFVVTDSRSQRGKKNSFLVQFKRPRRHHHHDASLLSTYADDA